MAKLIQAVAWLFGLGMVSRRIGQLDDVVQSLAYGFDLTKSLVPSVLSNMQAVIIRFFNQFGSAVKLPGMGTCMPTAGSEGRIRVSLREAPVLRGARELREAQELRNAPNADGAFRGDLAIRAKMGTNALPPPRRSSPL